VANKPADAAPPKSKKLLMIVGVVVLVLALAGAGAIYFINKQRAAADDGEQEAVAQVVEAGPPSYLPLDSMVVNLADPGGERVAQIGITLEVIDAKSVEEVKKYLPTIRSGVLLLVSQRTAAELLQIEGKEKLAKDILREAARPFGGGGEDDKVGAAAETAAKKPKTTKPPGASEQMPVKGVLFSSFIVQ
jgi:flagellar FliL protein